MKRALSDNAVCRAYLAALTQIASLAPLRRARKKVGARF
jgi:hypothetical protein